MYDRWVTCGDSTQTEHWFFWFGFIIFLPLCGWIVVWIRKCYSRFETCMVFPIELGTLTLVSCEMLPPPPSRTLVTRSAKTPLFWAGSGGLFVYEEFKIASWADLGLIYLGLFLLVVGVCLVVFCRPLPRGEQEKGDEAAEPQTASA